MAQMIEASKDGGFYSFESVCDTLDKCKRDKTYTPSLKELVQHYVFNCEMTAEIHWYWQHPEKEVAALARLLTSMAE